MKLDKKKIVNDLVEDLSAADSFYIVNTEGLTANRINQFRKECFSNEVLCRVVKNNLIGKAIDHITKFRTVLKDNEAFKGVSAVLIPGGDSSGVPAKVLLKFRKETEVDKPLLKCAVIDGDLFLGDTSLATLSDLKSKHELIGDILLLLKSPISNVMSSLSSGSSRIAGILGALNKN
jgi:large subunit ribosomal protein L10